MNGLQSVETSYGTELIRKGIHMSSLAIPVVYYFITRETALGILVPLFLLFGISDLARVFIPAFGSFYERWFGFLLRRHELAEGHKRLNGATYVLLSAALCVWLFPKMIVITAFAILIVSDTAAALIGRKFGKHPLVQSKSIEGSTAFFISALMVVAIAPKVQYLPLEYVIGAVAALVGTAVEAVSGELVDDNLSIPLSISLVMWGLYTLLLPALNFAALEGLS
jgi:dolichol kinase